MAKKRVLRKKVSRTASKKKSSSRSSIKQFDPKRKIKIALRDLILFVLLSLISFILYSASGNEIYQDTFYLLGIVFGFVALAFLILYLALLFSKGKVKNK